MKYKIEFFKTVSDSTGHCRPVLQNTVIVTAQNEQEALQSAKAALCASHGIPEWTLHADEARICEVFAGPEPSVP